MECVSIIGTLFKLMKTINFPRHTNVSSNLLSGVF